MNQLFNPVGPEANNSRAPAFEDDVASWMRELGWSERCRNIDLFHEEGEQSKGVDILGAFDDPQLGERHGLIVEAKIRRQLQASKTHSELSTLASKVAKLGPVVSRIETCQDIHVTRTGILVYDTKPFDPAKLRTILSGFHPAGTTRSEWPREVMVIGPDSLIGLADAFNLAAPHKFFWPPFQRSAGEWNAAAPPRQVTAGVLAWKSRNGKVSLWLRDDLRHDDDFLWISELVWEWRIDVDRIICSSLSREHWATQRARWESVARKAANRDTGRVPDAIEIRELSWDSLTPFRDRWGPQAQEAAA